jgi:hypothetical protein
VTSFLSVANEIASIIAAVLAIPTAIVTLSRRSHPRNASPVSDEALLSEDDSSTSGD